MANRGRPTKLTPEVHKRIVDAVAAGNYHEVAAQYAGIDKATFCRWMVRGEKEAAGIFREFCDAIKNAEAQAEVRDVDIIVKAGQDSWQAVAWRLERKHFARWGRKERQEHTGEGGGPVTIRVVYDGEEGAS